MIYKTGDRRSGRSGTSKDQFSNNQLPIGDVYHYDAAGNQTLINGNTISYDAEGRQTQVSGLNVNEQYVYDGEGRRVAKLGGAGQLDRLFAYDAMGRMAAEYSAQAEMPGCVTVI